MLPLPPSLTHLHSLTQSDQLAGAFLLAVAVIVFVYYTLWVIVLVSSHSYGHIIRHGYSPRLCMLKVVCVPCGGVIACAYTES